MRISRKLNDIKSEILSLGDPLELVPGTMLWGDVTYTGAGIDLI